MTRLTDDERILLNAFATAPTPIGLYEVMQQIMPPRPDGPGWDGQQWWGQQWCATARNFIDLRRWWMVRPAYGTGGYVVTDRGRAALSTQWS